MSGRLVVVGDSLLDVDVQGRADRLAPDAPVPVVEASGETSRPGGAALSAWLAAAAGMDVTLVTAIPDDDHGRHLRALLGGTVRMVDLPCSGSTAVKRRVRVADTTVLRLHEGTGARPLGGDAGLAEVASSASAILVSDYAGGVCAEPSVRALVADRVGTVPVVWDPHPRGARPVPGTWLVTPNEREAGLLSGVEADADLAAWERAAEWASDLARQWESRAVAVTLGRDGAVLAYASGAPMVFPSRRAVEGDACGAGDRFAVAAAARLGAGDVLTEAVSAAVSAAEEFVRTGGATAATSSGPPSSAHPAGDRTDDVQSLVDRLRRAGGRLVAAGGCFDLLHPGHVHTLRAARALGDGLVVCLNSDRSVARLKGPGRPLVHAEGRAAVLRALDCVDAVAVFDESTPEAVLRRLRPDVWVKGGDYEQGALPEAAVVQDWGGRTAIVPYVPGWSTTSLLEAATGSAGVDRATSVGLA